MDATTSRDKSALTRRRLLDAAEALVADEGYSAPSHRSIARRAGVHVALVNYHYGSKEMLLEAVVATEQTEPQAVIGSYLQKLAYPENFARFQRTRDLTEAYDHGGNVLSLQLRGEYLYTAKAGRHRVSMSPTSNAFRDALGRALPACFGRDRTRLPLCASVDDVPAPLHKPAGAAMRRRPCARTMSTG
jgi:AcrR family transcriptional regulator